MFDKAERVSLPKCDRETRVGRTRLRNKRLRGSSCKHLSMTRLHDIEIREMPSIKAMMKLDREGKQKGESQCQEERRIVGKLKG
jgi:hypothetical protein